MTILHRGRILPLLLALALLPAAAGADPVADLQGRIAGALLQPAVEPTVEQVFMALQFQLGSVEHAAHWAGRGAHQGTVDLTRVTPEIDRLNKVWDQLHNYVLYRLADRKQRHEAVDLLLEMRRRAAETVRVVIEKSPDPNSRDNQKRYQKASRAFQETLGRLAALFGLTTK